MKRRWLQVILVLVPFMLGALCSDDDGDRSALEIGYLFDRRLKFTSGIGDFYPDDTAIIRWTRLY